MQWTSTTTTLSLKWKRMPHSRSRSSRFLTMMKIRMKSRTKTTSTSIPTSPSCDLNLRHGRLAREEVALAADDDPVRALLLVHVEALAVVAAHALRHDDLRPFDRA